MKTLTIFAGINGAGKTTFYNQLKSKQMDLGDYICPDDILKKQNGDWKSATDIINSASIAIKQIKDCLDNNSSFCWETSIFGNFGYNVIEKAKEHGYHIALHYFLVSDVNQSIDRVKSRVETGGHGVSDKVITVRYNNQTRLLSKILPMVNVAYFYENKDQFELKAVYVKNKILFYNMEKSIKDKLLSELSQNQNINEQ